MHADGLRSVDLEVVPGGLPAAVYGRDGWFHLAGTAALRWPGDLDVDTWVRGQLGVTAHDEDGRAVLATGVQLPGLLDERYATDLPLGVVWHDRVPEVRLWAPTARRVVLHLFADPDPATAGDVVPMVRDGGVWSCTGEPGWDRRYYRFEVEVYAPDTDRIEINHVTDPWSVSLAADSARSQLVRLDDPDLAPPGWDALDKPPFAGQRDLVVYELHVRDFSQSDPEVPVDHRGRYTAFALADSAGLRHLRGLADAGVTHLHLLPVFDFATVPDRPGDRLEPDIGRPDDPASEAPQAAVAAVAGRDGFNWGYDPWHWSVPEGSYASDPDGVARIRELRGMVAALNRLGLRVVMDVVYNHTHAAGQDPRSVLDRIVPGYHHRLCAAGGIETSTCCPNTATEHAMTARLVVDSVLTWARHHKVDGFRFDLMGHHPKALMTRIRRALDGLTLEDDGVDGRRIVLYGEGWEFGEVADDARFVPATQRTMAGCGIGLFDDRLRDAVRGGSPFGDPRRQGFATGLAVDPNETDQGDADEQAAEARRLADLVRLGLAGGLADYRFETADGVVRAGRDLDYDDGPAGFAAAPVEQVVYVSAHDNETLFDAVQAKLPMSTPMDQRVRVHNLALSLVALAQGTPFFHAGSDLLRSKSLDRDSFASGDWFNRLDWTATSSNWGVGLPPAAKNREHWDLMRTLLRRLPAPTPTDIARCRDHLRELLRIRAGSPRFRLPDAAAVQAQLRFHATGPTAPLGVIAMSLTGGSMAGDDLLVVFNASTTPWRLHDPDLAGAWALHPVLRESTDPMVRTATWTDGGAEVPARTTAVFQRPTRLADRAASR